MSVPASKLARHGVIGPVLFGGPRTRQAELPSYAGFFGFVAPPFDLTLDPRFVYLGRSHAQARAEILDGLQRREGVIVLTGASGTGKTTLYRWTLQSVSGPTFASIVVDPLITAHELLVQVLTDFGVISTEFARGESVSHIGCHELTLVLRRFLDSLVPSGARALIVIDDAHQVSRDVLSQLRALSNLETATAKQLQIMLVGQPSLETTLETPELASLKQRVSRQCRLEPLTADEIAAFIERRLAVALGRRSPAEADGAPAAEVARAVGELRDAAEEHADGASDVSFSRPALAVLAQLSEGVPRTLTRLCDRALEVAASQQERRVAPAHVFQAAGRVNVPVRFTDRIRIGRSAVMLSVAVVVAAAFWALWMSRGARSEVTETSTTVSGQPAAGATTPASTSAPASAPMSGGTSAPGSIPPSSAVSARAAAGSLADAESFVLMVASFRNADGAREVRQQLLDNSLPAFVREDGRWHVVYVGPFATRSEADAALDQIDRSVYVDAHVVKSNN